MPIQILILNLGEARRGSLGSRCNGRSRLSYDCAVIRASLREQHSLRYVANERHTQGKDEVDFAVCPTASH